jgi:hypothetical protein
MASVIFPRPACCITYLSSNSLVHQLSFLEQLIATIIIRLTSLIQRTVYCNNYLLFFSLSNNIHILQHQLFLFSPSYQHLIAIVTFHFQQLYCTIHLASSSPSTNSLLQLAFNFPSSYKQHIPLLPLHEQLIATFTFALYPSNV